MLLPQDGTRRRVAQVSRPVFLFLSLATALAAQSLSGVIDIHVHAAPDSVPRSIDAITLARLAKSKGMRGLVLKSHYEPTASLAWMVRRIVPGIEIFGSIDLNRTVGGVNPAAVERMTMMLGGLGRVVWMPTLDAENQVRYSRENRPYVAVESGGELLPEVKQVIAIVAKHKLTLETGHSSAAEALLIIREARKQGVEHIVVTHAMLAPVRMTIPQMKEAAGLGAYIEFVYNGLIGPGKMFDMAEYAQAIRQVGPDHCILASDLGQVGNPLHPDGLLAFFQGLKAQGLTNAEIGRMSRTNPAKALGLE
ncbi:MAG TPA: DUF6282 family protein [Candidatus Binataceae bacterium]|nr:DUF6282 family protein [Candidatus Binataceae bacterium]